MNTPKHPRNNRLTRHAAARAFTIIELLVVILIISASLATVVPLIGALTRTSRVEAGINTISAAINAARILSHRYKETDKGSGGWPPYPNSADYSGTAVIFCPGGDIRFVINDQKAYTGTSSPGSAPPNGASDYLFIENFGATGNLAHPDKANGYRDLSGIDYAKLPNGSGIVGVRRIGTGATDVEFLAPPFAVRFNERGQVASDQIVIYYDSNYDGIYGNGGGNVKARRIDFSSPNYNPANWLPKSNLTGNLATLDTSSKTYTLPFEQIETVNAVVLYDENKFARDGLVWGTSTTVDITRWMQDNLPTPTEERRDANSRALYFSPYTGLIIPESIQ
jgi:type II secretory pathway pseudopilin PulG